MRSAADDGGDGATHSRRRAGTPNRARTERPRDDAVLARYSVHKRAMTQNRSSSPLAQLVSNVAPLLREHFVEPHANRRAASVARRGLTAASVCFTAIGVGRTRLRGRLSTTRPAAIASSTRDARATGSCSPRPRCRSWASRLRARDDVVHRVGRPSHADAAQLVFRGARLPDDRGARALRGGRGGGRGRRCRRPPRPAHPGVGERARGADARARDRPHDERPQGPRVPPPALRALAPAVRLHAARTCSFNSLVASTAIGPRPRAPRRRSGGAPPNSFRAVRARESTPRKSRPPGGRARGSQRDRAPRSGDRDFAQDCEPARELVSSAAVAESLAHPCRRCSSRRAGFAGEIAVGDVTEANIAFGQVRSGLLGVLAAKMATVVRVNAAAERVIDVCAAPPRSLEARRAAARRTSACESRLRSRSCWRICA